MNQTPTIEFFNFKDFDRYSEFIRQADLEYSQISRGSFQGSLIQVLGNKVILSCHQMNQKIIQEGIGLKGHYTFLIPGNFEQNFIWRNIRFKGNTIGILRGDMEHYCVSQSNFFGIPVSIEATFLKELSSKLGYPGFIDLLEHQEYFVISEKMAKLLQFYIPLICHNQVLNQHLISYEIPKIIITSILESGKKLNGVTLNANDRIFNKARKLIHSEPENCTSVKDLCRRMGVSERSLQYAFSDLSGMSPKKYMQFYRLNEIKRKIDSKQYDRLLDITLPFGFWHSGQFAKDYKKVFGILPSEHLKKLS